MEETTTTNPSKKRTKSIVPDLPSETGQDRKSLTSKEASVSRSKSRKLSKSPLETVSFDPAGQSSSEEDTARSQSRRLSRLPSPKSGAGKGADSQSPKDISTSRSLSKKLSKSSSETFARGANSQSPADAAIAKEGSPKSLSPKPDVLHSSDRKIIRGDTTKSSLTHGATLKSSAKVSPKVDFDLKENPGKSGTESPSGHDVHKKFSKDQISKISIESTTADQKFKTEETETSTSRGQEGKVKMDLEKSNETELDETSPGSTAKDRGHRLKDLSAKEADTGSPTPDESIVKQAITFEELVTADLETIRGLNDMGYNNEDAPHSDETKSTPFPLSGETSTVLSTTRETIQSLLGSSDTLPEEEDMHIEEKTVEGPPQQPGDSHFKFLKSRCGKLVDVKTWKPAWQGYNAQEREKSWKPIDEWAPTRQFIRYQGDLVVWRHQHPLAQHIGWDRGYLAKYCKRPMLSSSWDN